MKEDSGLEKSSEFIEISGRAHTKKRKRMEIYRKSIHISSLIIPFMYRFGLPLFFTGSMFSEFSNGYRKVAIAFLVLLTLLALLIDVVRLHNKTAKQIFHNLFGLLLRKHEHSGITGASYMLVSSVFCVAFFLPDIAFVAISFLAIGDTLAAIVGISFGKRKLLGSVKSLEGSLACFIGTFVFAIFFLNPVVAFVGAVTATVAEFSAVKMDDNLKIPIASGIAMSIVNMFI